MDGKIEYPLATISYYGPDDKTPVKIVVAILKRRGFKDKIVALKRWVGTSVITDDKVKDEIKEFLEKHRIKQFVLTKGVLGCPHEEGMDYPRGQDCPLCPFWKGKKTSRFYASYIVGKIGDDLPW